MFFPMVYIWTDLSAVLSRFTRVTEGRTDGQTDRQTDRILIARPRLHSMQRGKKGMILYTSTENFQPKEVFCGHLCFIRVKTAISH